MKKWRRAIRSAATVLAMIVMIAVLASCGGNAGKAVGQCGGREIRYEEIRYEAGQYLKEHPECDDEELRNAIERAIRETSAIYLLAEEYGCDVSEEGLKAKVDRALEDAINDLGGKSEYKSYLKENGITESLLRGMLAAAQLELELGGKIDEKLASEESLLAWLDDGNYVRVKKLTVPFRNDETKAETEARAQNYGTLLGSGATPDSVIGADEKAAGVTLAPAEYVFRDLSDGSEEEISAALALENVGDISTVIETKDGYVLFLRVENAREILVDFQLDTLLYKYRARVVNALVDARAAELKMEWNEYGAGLDPAKLK